MTIFATEGIINLLIWVDYMYMPEVSWKINNKTTFIFYKNTALCLKYTIWLVEIMMKYANYKVPTMFTWTPSVMESYQILYAIV